ncbi:hypothetical protein AB0F17_34295 [Nonomuraea sp. NPDC026600]|uniref:beta barrel domain-containing protein n=1 Tax=Nonomuraea sp. NPDC026600 TaxID=3155363 RepID=UPI0033CF4FBF
MFDTDGAWMEQPQDGWPGKVTKAGDEHLTVEYLMFRQTFRRDNGRASEAFRRQWIETAETAGHNARRSAAAATLRKHGIRLDTGHRLTLERLEQVAALASTPTSS